MKKLTRFDWLMMAVTFAEAGMDLGQERKATPPRPEKNRAVTTDGRPVAGVRL
jgi:hypothetical protein